MVFMMLDFRFVCKSVRRECRVCLSVQCPAKTPHSRLTPTRERADRNRLNTKSRFDRFAGSIVI